MAIITSAFQKHDRFPVPVCKICTVPSRYFQALNAKNDLTVLSLFFALFPNLGNDEPRENCNLKLQLLSKRQSFTV